MIDRHFPDQLRCAGVAGANAGLVWQGLMPGLRVRHCLQLASTSFADGRMCLPHSAHSFFTAATSEPAAARELMRAVRSPSHTIAQCIQWASAAQRVIASSSAGGCLRVEYAVPYRSVRWLRMLPTGSDLAAFALPARQLMSDAVFLTRPRTDPSLPADHRAAGTALHCARTSAHFHTHSLWATALSAQSAVRRRSHAAVPVGRGALCCVQCAARPTLSSCRSEDAFFCVGAVDLPRQPLSTIATPKARSCVRCGRLLCVSPERSKLHFGQT